MRVSFGQHWSTFTYIFVGCWGNLGYLSMGFRRWSQSFAYAKKSACCQMGRWCWIRIDCHSYRSYEYLSTWILISYKHSYLTSENWLQGGELFQGSKSWLVTSLGRYNCCLFFFGADVAREYKEYSVCMIWCRLYILGNTKYAWFAVDFIFWVQCVDWHLYSFLILEPRVCEILSSWN
jgi:hypothetical protein